MTQETYNHEVDRLCQMLGHSVVGIVHATLAGRKAGLNEQDIRNATRAFILNLERELARFETPLNKAGEKGDDSTCLSC